MSVRTYHFRARDPQNRIITGVIQASSLEEASKLLVKNKMSPISVAPPKGLMDFIPFFGKVSSKQITLFSRQLATMLDAGLTISQAMRLLVGQTTSTKFREVIESVLADIQEGFSFSSSLGKHPEIFSTIFVNAVRSGEATGKLDIVLAQLSTSLEKDQKVQGKIKGALVYPAFIIVAMIGVAVIMLTQVIPQLKGVFDQSGMTLPGQTLLLLWLSNTLINYWVYILVGVVTLGLGMRYYLRSESGKVMTSRLSLRIPVMASITERSAMASFGRLMGMLLSSGVPLLDTLRLIEQAFNNQIYKEAIRQVSAAVERGVPMSVPISKNTAFPAMLGQMVAVGEQTGKMDEVMNRMAAYYEEEVENEVATLSTLIEPMTIILLGVGVAWLVMAILIPVYQISTSQ